MEAFIYEHYLKLNFFVPSLIPYNMNFQETVWAHRGINGVMLWEVMGKLWPTLRKIRTERDHFPQGEGNVDTQVTSIFFAFFFGGGREILLKYPLLLHVLVVWEVCWNINYLVGWVG